MKSRFLLFLFFFSLSLLISSLNASGEHGSGWREVPVDDPEVQQAAKHSAKIMSQRVNCMYPFELQEVEHANAEVTGEAVKFNMLLKLKLGKNPVKFKVEVHKNHEGALHLHDFKQHPN